MQMKFTFLGSTVTGIERDAAAEGINRKTMLSYFTDIFNHRTINLAGGKSGRVKNIALGEENGLVQLTIETNEGTSEMFASEALKLNPDMLMAFLENNFAENQPFAFWDQESHSQIQASIVSVKDDLTVTIKMSDGDNVEMDALDFFNLAPERSVARVAEVSQPGAVDQTPANKSNLRNSSNVGTGIVSGEIGSTEATGTGTDSIDDNKEKAA